MVGDEQLYVVVECDVFVLGVLCFGEDVLFGVLQEDVDGSIVDLGDDIGVLWYFWVGLVEEVQLVEVEVGEVGWKVQVGDFFVGGVEEGGVDVVFVDGMYEWSVFGVVVGDGELDEERRFG